jgi:two-component system sensor histidine kinase HydH
MMSMKLPRWDLWGALAGLLLGAGDVALLMFRGVEMTLAGEDATLEVGLFFGSSFVLGGFLIGRLMRARGRARADATTIERQVAALDASRRMAAQNEKLAAIGRLAAGIAHEVRNPLGVIRASASMVQESFDRDDEAFRACQFIREEIDRLDGLIGSLLQFARPSRLRARPISIDKVIDRALALADEELRKREIDLGRAFDPALPELVGDPDLLAQLLLGLVTNSWEALGRGGRIELRVCVDPDPANPIELHVEVADSGPGIPQEDTARVLEPFFTTKPTGTGLGLAMAARIASAHGGGLEVVDGAGAGPDGAGACLRLRLPLTGPEVGAEPGAEVAA